MIGLPDKAMVLAMAMARCWPDATPVLRQQKNDPARLAGSDQTTTLDCAGSSARITGSNNKVTMTGSCTRLTILGSRAQMVHHLGYGNTLKQGQ